MEALERLRAWLAQWANPHGVKEIEKREEIQNEVSEAKVIAEPRRTLTMNLVIVSYCDASPNSITVFFSEPVNQSDPNSDSQSALNPNNYTVYDPGASPYFNRQPTNLSSVSIVNPIQTFGSSAVIIPFTPDVVFNRGDWVLVTASGISSLDATHATAAAHVNGKNALRIENVVANSTNVTVYFSDYLDTSKLNKNSGSDPNYQQNYTIIPLAPPVGGTETATQVTIASATYNSFNKATFLQLAPSQQLQPGQWVLLTVSYVASEAGPIGNGGNNTFSARVEGGGDGGRRLRQEAREITESVEDAVAYPLLTEQVSFPAGGPAISSGGGVAPASPRTGVSLGQIATNAITDVLGWKANSTDPKGFIGALTQSFTLQDVEGHVEATWVPRSYAVQTDIGGGITGAQASLYTRAKDALDKALPLLDGLYPLDPDADPEYVKALREMARSQMTEIVKELGTVGGPSILRVNTYFRILLGQENISFQPGVTVVQFNPDQIQGTLGKLRDTYGIYFLNNPFSNSVEDEEDITNFRVISDYMTSLLQSWISNGQFFVLGTTQPNFFGTQLVLLSRQFSVIGETVNELRFALDSVFIGPSERQTLLLEFADLNLPAIFLEDMLREIESFAAEEGPRLLQDGGRISVANNIIPVMKSYRHMVQQAHRPANLRSLPDGYRTVRVQRALDDLHDQVRELINLAIPVIQKVPLPVQEPEEGFQVLNVSPNSSAGPITLPVTIMGSGFKPGATATFTSTSNGTIKPNFTAFLSENLLVAQINLPATVGSYDVVVTNPGGKSGKALPSGFTIVRQMTGVGTDQR